MDLPFDDATFEVVWSQDVLMNIADKPRLFAEVHRVLRPGGRLTLQASLASQGTSRRRPYRLGID